MCEPEAERFGVIIGDRLPGRQRWEHATLEGVALSSTATEGVSIDSLEPGTTLVINTRKSSYRFVILFHPGLVLVKGGAMFPEATVVRLEGATAGGSALKMGWILVGFQMEMWLGFLRIRSSRVRSMSIECIPAVCAFDNRPQA